MMAYMVKGTESVALRLEAGVIAPAIGGELVTKGLPAGLCVHCWRDIWVVAPPHNPRWRWWGVFIEVRSLQQGNALSLWGLVKSTLSRDQAAIHW